MKAKIVTAEDYVTSRPIKVLVISPHFVNDKRIFRALRKQPERMLRINFTENKGELRIVLPDEVAFAIDKKKEN